MFLVLFIVSVERCRGLLDLSFVAPLLKIERAVASQQLPVRPLVSSDSSRSVYPLRHSQPPFLITIAIGELVDSLPVNRFCFPIFFRIQIFLSFDPFLGAPNLINLLTHSPLLKSTTNLAA